VDAIYSPVQRVRYKVEDTRVGQKTNYDKLTIEVWTNGTVTPEMAIVEGAKILRKHLNPFVQYFELGQERVSEEASAAAGVDEELIRKLNMPISELELSVRASNCLESARIETVGQLVSRSDATCSSSARSGAPASARSSANSRTSAWTWASKCPKVSRPRPLPPRPRPESQAQSRA